MPRFFKNVRTKRWSCFVSKNFFDARYEGPMVPLRLRICLERAKSPSSFPILKQKNKTTICFSYSAHVNYFSSTSSRSTFSFSYYFLSYFWFMRHMLCAPFNIALSVTDAPEDVGSLLIPMEIFNRSK